MLSLYWETVKYFFADFYPPLRISAGEKKHLWELPLICSAKKSSFCKSIIRQTGSMLKRLLIYLPTATSFGGNYCWYFVGGFQSWWGPPEPKVQLKNLFMLSLCCKRPLQNCNNHFENGFDPTPHSPPPFWTLSKKLHYWFGRATLSLSMSPVPLKLITNRDFSSGTLESDLWPGPVQFSADVDNHDDM